ncbi:formylglycine-generating enzyme family protein [Paenibacillus eucommiae]|uniref:Formylglycine-generating enzyme required for sulfatase activity n=1 Tax=Paenibacillus eucommiae TaxID=1355755 RepID=A0ABS4J1F5_9BACL|nr:formylglycine-generating enzyme family protein [Paenibacillus eucommiae]MBP1993630.1 formylglycine-generating enzyme required for sulfatase activity [Paenibacillus eucommiae]
MNQLEQSSCCSVSRSEGGGLQAVSMTGLGNKQDPLQGMIALPGGTFLMGSSSEEGFKQDGEGPVRNVSIAPFLVDPCTVTNEQFAEFVQATGYVSDAERFGWSFVFHLFASPETIRSVTQRVDGASWWLVVEGASWDKPEGPDSSIADRLDHPVVHVSWNDANAYCRWAGKRLLSEAEWEYAARGGLIQKRYPWGDLLKPDGRHVCNIWQGKFPDKSNKTDSCGGTSAARSFPPNGYGLYNVSGNVWEWCSDWFHPEAYQFDTPDNPKGPAAGTSKVIRGGSYLCHRSYCNRYRVAARSSNTPDSTTGHMGFRCAADA